jgi:acetyl-CoA C-acetyltransferase
MTSTLEGLCGLSVVIDGMSGVKMVNHALIEGIRRGAKLAVCTTCVGSGQGTTSLFEAAQ